MKPMLRSDTSYQQIVRQIPPEVVATFTPQQLDALQQACQQVNWQNQHTIDLRLSIPVPKPGFYIGFLIGSERRSAARLRPQRLKSSRQTATKVAVSVLLLGGMAVVVVFKVIQPLTQFIQEAKTHPTGIPWLQSETACQTTDRNWQEGTCLDQEHDPNF